MFSYTQPRENIIKYRPWYLKRDGEWQEWDLAEGRVHGKGIVAKFAQCDDRDMAFSLMECEIGIRRDQLPAAGPGEYYWRDLQGLTVVTLDGETLGTVDHLLETGANDVLVVKGDRERLIPFVVDQVITGVDLEEGTIQVDWDKDF